MDSNLERAEPCASQNWAEQPVAVWRTEARVHGDHESLAMHAANMEKILRRLRGGMALSVGGYRQWRISKEMQEIRDFYLTAEGKILCNYMKEIRALRREAGRDLRAMRRKLKNILENQIKIENIRDGSHEQR